MHRGAIGSGPQEFLPEDRAWGRVSSLGGTSSMVTLDSIIPKCSGRRSKNIEKKTWVRSF